MNQSSNVVGRRLAIQPLEGEFAVGVLLPDAVIEKLQQEKRRLTCVARLDFPVTVREPRGRRRVEVDRVRLVPHLSDLGEVFRPGGPVGRPVVADVWCIERGASAEKGGILLGRAALWRSPDVVDSTPLRVPSHLELESRGIEESAAKLRQTLKMNRGIEISFDLDSLMRLDNIIEQVLRPPIQPDQVGRVIVPWADFVTMAILHVFGGQLFKDPADGVGVRMPTSRGFVVVSPLFPLWRRLERGLDETNSISAFVRDLQKKIRGAETG